MQEAVKPSSKKVFSKFNEKPFSVLMYVRTSEDGLLSNFVSMRILTGSEKKPKFGLLSCPAEVYDDKVVSYQNMNVNSAENPQAIATTILQRFAMTTFSTNPARRLPANKIFFLNLRVVIARADKAIRVSLKEICPARYKSGEFINGTSVERSDPIFRSFRKALKFLPIAFARLKFYDPSEEVVRAVAKQEPKEEKPVRKAAPKVEKKVAAKKVVVKKPAKAVEDDGDFEI